jgi:hypothetical protein
MFRVVSNGPNRIDLEFAGKLDADDMRVGLDELINKAQGIEHGRMLYRIGDFDIPTFGALGAEFSRIPELFKLIRKFDRVAVLADQGWIKKVSEIEGALFPGVDIKAFSLDEEIEAEAWLKS